MNTTAHSPATNIMPHPNPVLPVSQGKTFQSAGGTPRHAVLSLSIKEKAGLYAAYMPFVEGGGLFIPTQKNYNMGDMVYIILQLMESPKKFSIAGKVVWVSHAGGMTQAMAGVGIQLPQDASGLELRQFIEQSLGTALGASRKTHTL